MKRAGGWILGLVAVAAMAAAAGFIAWRVVPRESVDVVLVRSGVDRDPTVQALEKGARFALEEAGHRAGRYRLRLLVYEQGLFPASPAWLGMSESILLQGDVQPRPFVATALVNRAHVLVGGFCITPGWTRQGSAAAAWARAAKAARVFLLQDSDSSRSSAIAAAFAPAARAQGLEVDGPSNTTSNALDRIVASKPDLVFYAGEEAPYGTAAKVFSELRRRGFGGSLAMAEADPEVSFLATRPDLVEGSYLVSPFAPAPADVAARMGGVPGPHVTAGYHSMRAVIDAIDLAGSIDPDLLRRAAARLPCVDAAGESTRPCALYVARNGRFEFVKLLE